uniref:Uncharacterized protein n=1 Tax=Arundo donax TaxID=35708 RepID=A0A0A9EQD3_ARUDO
MLFGGQTSKESESYKKGKTIILCDFLYRVGDFLYGVGDFLYGVLSKLMSFRTSTIFVMLLHNLNGLAFIHNLARVLMAMRVEQIYVHPQTCLAGAVI